MAITVKMSEHDLALRDIGLLLQAVACLELAFDDLLGLANARIQGINKLLGRFPVQFDRKVKYFIKIAERLDFKLDAAIFTKAIEEILKLRQQLAHGRVIGFGNHQSGYKLIVAKFSTPKSVDGRQKLNRTQFELTRGEICQQAESIEKMHTAIEKLSGLLFQSGEGWPDFLVMPEADPLGLKTPLTGMVGSKNTTTRQENRV